MKEMKIENGLEKKEDRRVRRTKKLLSQGLIELMQQKQVKDITVVNDKVIKSAGVAGVIKPGKTSVQVIIGTKVQFVEEAFSKLCE